MIKIEKKASCGALHLKSARPSGRAFFFFSPLFSKRFERKTLKDFPQEKNALMSA